jgi:hypothetical protein
VARLGGAGPPRVNFTHQTHAVKLGFVDKKILKNLVTRFSQYSCLKISRILTIFDMQYLRMGTCNIYSFYVIL